MYVNYTEANLRLVYKCQWMLLHGIITWFESEVEFRLPELKNALKLTLKTTENTLRLRSLQIFVYLYSIVSISVGKQTACFHCDMITTSLMI